MVLRGFLSFGLTRGIAVHKRKNNNNIKHRKINFNNNINEELLVDVYMEVYVGLAPTKTRSHQVDLHITPIMFYINPETQTYIALCCFSLMSTKMLSFLLNLSFCFNKWPLCMAAGWLSLTNVPAVDSVRQCNTLAPKHTDPGSVLHTTPIVFTIRLPFSLFFFFFIFLFLYPVCLCLSSSSCVQSTPVCSSAGISNCGSCCCHVISWLLLQLLVFQFGLKCFAVALRECQSRRHQVASAVALACTLGKNQHYSIRDIAPAAAAGSLLGKGRPVDNGEHLSSDLERRLKNVGAGAVGRCSYIWYFYACSCCRLHFKIYSECVIAFKSHAMSTVKLMCVTLLKSSTILYGKAKCKLAEINSILKYIILNMYILHEKACLPNNAFYIFIHVISISAVSKSKCCLNCQLLLLFNFLC